MAAVLIADPTKDAELHLDEELNVEDPPLEGEPLEEGVLHEVEGSFDEFTEELLNPPISYRKALWNSLGTALGKAFITGIRLILTRLLSRSN